MCFLDTVKPRFTIPAQYEHLINYYELFAFSLGKNALIFSLNREEKSLRHVAMVAKFLHDNKPKIHLKSKFALFQTSSILFNFV